MTLFADQLDAAEPDKHQAIELTLEAACDCLCRWCKAKVPLLDLDQTVHGPFKVSKWGRPCAARRVRKLAREGLHPQSSTPNQ